MIPQRIDPTWDDGAETLCAFAAQWGLDALLAWRLGRLAKVLQFAIMMVSGWRSYEEQRAVSETSPDVSTHTACPFATGADIQVVGWSKATAPVEVRRAFGAAAQLVGLRWGGGSRPDPRWSDVPSDWNHVDLGPRARA